MWLSPQVMTWIPWRWSPSIISRPNDNLFKDWKALLHLMLSRVFLVGSKDSPTPCHL